MIHKLSANKESFHTVTFTEGLNVILAERIEASTEKDTRNGVGKSTLIEIIDFCLGSGGYNGKGLVVKPLIDWIFTLEITLAGNKVEVTRVVADQGRILIHGDTGGWIEQPEYDSNSGEHFFKVNRWRTLLGWAFFKLPDSTEQLPYKPSYRSLVPYLIRSGPDAYTSPFRHFRQQKTWSMQLHIAYLLGMNWEYAARWQGFKDKEEGVKAIEKAIQTGVIEGFFGTISELETQSNQLEKQSLAAKKALDTFKVYPQYESVQLGADRITKEIHELTKQNIIGKRRLTQYQESINNEKPPSTISLESLYEESGLIFPDTVKRSLSEVRDFHHQILINRRGFLEMEIKHLEQSIEDDDSKIQDLTEKRAQQLQVLKTHGALQELTVLQVNYAVLQGNLNSIQSRLKEIKGLKKTKAKVKTDKTELVQIAEQDHEQRRDVWSDAVHLFNEHSQALYKTPGYLVIDVSETGYKYKVDIERSGSEGIEKMKVFCFDLAVLQLQLQKRQGIDFIIHDTLMYDAVDARQRALAFERANEVTTALGGQYICTINSDMVPFEDFSDGFDFNKYVRLRLTDATPSGSLLGFRFDKVGKI